MPCVVAILVDVSAVSTEAILQDTAQLQTVCGVANCTMPPNSFVVAINSDMSERMTTNLMTTIDSVYGVNT